jgi:hypothetical protein
MGRMSSGSHVAATTCSTANVMGQGDNMDWTDLLLIGLALIVALFSFS